MFDTKIVKTSASYPQSIRVETHEHRAPTEESVRLLSEMEQRAFERVVAAYVEGPGNWLQGATIVIQPNHMTLGRKYFIAFKLNGRDVLCELEVDVLCELEVDELVLAGADDARAFLHRTIADSVAAEIVLMASKGAAE